MQPQTYWQPDGIPYWLRPDYVQQPVAKPVESRFSLEKKIPLTEQVMKYLKAHTGWVKVNQLSAALNVPNRSIWVSLHSLRSKGLVNSMRNPEDMTCLIISYKHKEVLQ